MWVGVKGSQPAFGESESCRVHMNDKGNDLLSSVDTIDKFLLQMLKNFSGEGDPERRSRYCTVSDVHHMHIHLPWEEE